MEKEIFKDIPEYEGIYQVSNLGNVKSLNYCRTGKQRVLKGHIKTGGYYGVSLCKNSKKETRRIHQLVAVVFLNYKFCDFPNKVVDHIDSNKLNNHLNNLRVITQRENCSKERSIKSGLPVGVYFNKSRNKFRADIRINGNRYYLGYYNTIEQASQAYQNKLKTL